MPQVLGSQRPSGAPQNGAPAAERKGESLLEEIGSLAGGKQPRWLGRGPSGREGAALRGAGPANGWEVQDIRPARPGSLRGFAFHPSSVPLPAISKSGGAPEAPAKMPCKAALSPPPPSLPPSTAQAHRNTHTPQREKQRSRAGPLRGGLPVTPAAGRETCPETSPPPRRRRSLLTELTHFSAA